MYNIIVSDFYFKKLQSEVLKESINVLFSLGFEIIITDAFKENTISIRLIEKCNMSRLEKTEFVDYRTKKHKCIFY